MTPLSITPLAPLIARDGRPFNPGSRMKGLDWPYPSVLAGSLRTLLGKLEGREFPPDTVTALKAVEVHGPLPLFNDQLYFPAAADLVLDSAGGRYHKARPCAVAAPAGCDLRDGLRPALLPELEADFKPGVPPPFWSFDRMTEWLVERGFPVPGPIENPGPGFLAGPQRDERTQTAIDTNRGVAQDKLLFQTVALDFPYEVTMAARVRAENGLAKFLVGLKAVHPIGGERRLAYWQTPEAPPPAAAAGGKKNKKTKAVVPLEVAPAPDPWRCPDAVRQTLSGNRRLVRMVLATPALFDDGWKPKWAREGRPPGLDARDDIKLKLVSACVPRWRPLSGWNFEIGKTGPKAVRRLAPAGSVYFFEVSGAASALARLWLRPVSDQDQDRRDGFGLALWGVWSD